MSIGQTMLTPLLSFRKLYNNPRSEVVVSKVRGFIIHTVACNCGIFEIFVPTGQQHDI